MLSRSFTCAFGVCFTGWLFVASAHGQLADPIPGPIPQSSLSIRLTEVAGGLNSPVWATSAEDGSGRLFVLDQTGQARIIQGGVLLSELFLDVSPGNPAGNPSIVELMPDFDERGLLGMAFHPEFGEGGSPGFGKVYTYTSEPVQAEADFPLPAPGDVNNQSVIREWTVDVANPNRIDPGSVREILRIDQPQFNHAGGTVVFGPDDFLYVSLGDGGAADDQGDGHLPGGNAQSLETVLGKTLRLDVDNDDFPDDPDRNYAVPDDNPFVDQAGLDEIFAYGLRNPYRISFDRETGMLIGSDAGQNDIEEINIITAGGNFGWRLKEGSFAFDPNGEDDGFVTDDLTGLPPDLLDPIFEYDHDEGVVAIGGFVYRGSAVPALQGKYIFGEHEGARLFVGDLDTGEFEELQINPAGAQLDLALKGFGEDAAGELYVLVSGEGPFAGNGRMLQVIPEPSAVALAGIASLAMAAIGLLRRLHAPSE